MGSLSERVVLGLRNWWLRRTRGFDDAEMYWLPQSMAEYCHARLEVYKDTLLEPPDGMDKDDWTATVNTICYALFVVAKQRRMEVTPVNPERVKCGLELFGKHFTKLRW